MVSDFCNKILKAGNHLVYDFPSSIFKQDISYTVKNGELDIFIHCPIVSMSSIPAFQYLGLPGILHETNKGPVLFIESREREIHKHRVSWVVAKLLDREHFPLQRQCPYLKKIHH